MRKITLFIFMFLTIIGGAKAKNVYTTTTLWEDTFTGNIAIPVSSLTAGATITVYTTVTDGSHVLVFYNKNNKNKDQASFKDNGGTITNWNWRNKDTESYVFTIDETDMSILNDNTEETGSTGLLYIGSGNAEVLTITKITKTVTSTEEATSTTTIWSGLVAKDAWGALEDSEMNTASKNVKKGDVFRVTVTNASAGSILICNASGWASLIEKNNVAQDEVQTIELEITDATTLEKIQNHGILVRNTAALTITKVELLTYASSYDCVPATIGSDGIATFSCSKRLDFTSTGVTPYSVTAVATGIVTLTATNNSYTFEYSGYILQGEAGTYDVPVTTESVDYPAQYLQGQVGQGIVKASESGDTKFRYIFAKNSSGDIGFYKLTADHTLAAHKAYLETDTDITSASSVKGVRFIFSDDVDGVVSTESKRIQDDAIYTLSGVCVKQPKKGLYITNGHTVFVK